MFCRSFEKNRRSWEGREIDFHLLRLMNDREEIAWEATQEIPIEQDDPCVSDFPSINFYAEVLKWHFICLSGTDFVSR